LENRDNLDKRKARFSGKLDEKVGSREHTCLGNGCVSAPTKEKNDLPERVFSKEKGVRERERPEQKCVAE